MSVSPRTTIAIRAMPLLPTIQHRTLETVEHGETIEDRLTTQAAVDRRSDAYLWRAFQLADVIERAPEHAVEYARLIKAAIRDGMALDAIEDEHRLAAATSAVSVQEIGRGVVTLLADHWAGGNGGSAA